MKKLLIVFLIIGILFLIPIPIRAKDGGTVVYQAVLYSVHNVHSFKTQEEGGGYNEGIIVKILGFEVFNSVK